MVRLGDGENRAVLRVLTKFADMDCLAMFLRCAEHPEIGGHLDGCLTFSGAAAD